MEERILTDEEIVKALVCCVQEDDNCNECPYTKKKIKCYFGRHESDCLGLIRRLQAKIETQRKIIEYQDGLPDIVEQQKAEIKRLTEISNSFLQEVIILNIEKLELQKQVGELLQEKGYLIERRNAGKKQAVKDTAKEIYLWLQDKDQRGMIVPFNMVLSQFKERYGVEVE